MLYAIKNGKMSATINSYGAEPVSVLYNGAERLRNACDKSWDLHSPALFPFCSTVEMWVDGKFYPNTIHGIAMNSEFALAGQTESAVTLRLTQNDETKKHYPFDFRLDISFEAIENGLSVTYSVFNPMDVPLPYACGSHESYSLDKPVNEYYLLFEKDERFLNRNAASRKTAAGYTDLGGGKILKLDNGFFENDASLVFLDMASRWVRLCKADGSPVAQVEFDDTFRDLVFWKKEAGSYICMEPWMNMCDFDDNKRLEFSRKRGICSLAPGKENTHRHTVTYF